MNKIAYLLLGIAALILIMPFSLGYTWTFNDTELEWGNGSNRAITSLNPNLAVDDDWSTLATIPSGGQAYIYENYTYSGIPVNISKTIHTFFSNALYNISYWNYTLNGWQNLTFIPLITTVPFDSYISINQTLPNDALGYKIRTRTEIMTSNNPFGYSGYYEGAILYGDDVIYTNSHNSSNINSVVGENVTFTLKINSSIITDTNATFYLNNTAYEVPLNGISQGNTQANITKSILMPQVSSTTLLPFYWNYTINGYNNVTYKANQTISPMSLTIGLSCAAGLNVSYNFTFADEKNQTRMAESIKYNFYYGLDNNTQYNTYGEIDNVNSLVICINASVQDNYSIGYGEIQYENKYGWPPRLYYLFAGTRATDISSNITLYSLNSVYTVPFQFIAKDYLLNFYSGYYLALLRWYPENNTYRVVEMARTNTEGSTVMNVELNNADYRVALYDNNGNLIKLDSPTKMVCLTAPCTYNLNVLGSGSDYTSIMGIQTSITYNNIDTVTFTWNDPSQKTSEIRFYVYKDSGYAETTICNVSSNLYVGVLNCNISGYQGTIVAKGYRAASPLTDLVSKIITIRSSIDKGIGLFVQLILSLLVGLLAAWSPLAAILFGIIPFLIGFALGIVSMQVLIGLFIIGGVIIHFIGRAQGK